MSFQVKVTIFFTLNHVINLDCTKLNISVHHDCNIHSSLFYSCVSVKGAVFLSKGNRICLRYMLNPEDGLSFKNEEKMDILYHVSSVNYTTPIDITSKKNEIVFTSVNICIG